MQKSDLSGKTIFPAHAGVFRLKQKFSLVEINFPRACGGEPSGIVKAQKLQAYSPQIRGCSREERDRDQAWTVFPAHAGVFLSLKNC